MQALARQTCFCPCLATVPVELADDILTQEYPARGKRTRRELRAPESCEYPARVADLVEKETWCPATRRKLPKALSEAGFRIRKNAGLHGLSRYRSGLCQSGTARQLSSRSCGNIGAKKRNMAPSDRDCGARGVCRFGGVGTAHCVSLDKSIPCICANVRSAVSFLFSSDPYSFIRLSSWLFFLPFFDIYNLRSSSSNCCSSSKTIQKKERRKHH